MGRSTIVTVRFNEKEMTILERVMKVLETNNRSKAIKFALLALDVYFLEGLNLTEILKPPKEVMKVIEEKNKL